RSQAAGETVPSPPRHGAASAAPTLWAGRVNEVERILRKQAQGAVVVLRRTSPIPALGSLAVGRSGLARGRREAGAGIGAGNEQGAFDGLLEGALGDPGAHGRSLRRRADRPGAITGGSSTMSM